MSWRNRDESSKQTAPKQEAPSRWESTRSDSQQSFRTYNNANNENDTEEELSTQQKDVQNRSLESSRRALAKMTLAEQTATSNLAKVASQSEQLTRVESKLDQASQKIKVSDAKADQLKSLSRLFFLPSFGGKKTSRVEAESKAQDVDMRFKMEASKGRQASRAEEIERASSSMRQNQQRGPSFNTTPYGVERCEVEQEVDSNLAQMSNGLSRLKMMGQAMNSELTTQSSQLGRLKDKTAVAEERLKTSARKIEKF